MDTLGAGDSLRGGGTWPGVSVGCACVRLGRRLRGAGRDSYPDRTFLERQIQALQQI